MDENENQLKNDVIDNETKDLTNPFYSENNLIIHKDIKNLTVTAKGNIISYADCENCVIESEEGTVFLLFGSLTNTNIKAAKNIYVKHSIQSKLIAGKDIVIEKSVFMSDIEAGDRIISESNESKIIGGTSKAKNSIISNEFGNEKNIKTEITLESRTGQVYFKKIYPGVKIKINVYDYSPKEAIHGVRMKIVNNKIALLGS